MFYPIKSLGASQHRYVACRYPDFFVEQTCNPFVCPDTSVVRLSVCVDSDPIGE